MTSMIPYDRYTRPMRRHWPFDELFEAPLASLTNSPSTVAFKMDVEDAGDSYVISSELPGVDRDQIDVELNEGRLSISVEKTESEEEEGKNYLHKESCSWSATRGVYLKDASVTGLSAKLENGILTVVVPKQEEKVNVTKVTID